MEKVWGVRGDPYIMYVRIISIMFNLTNLEVSLAAELLREYEDLKKRADSDIAWELLNSSKINKKIRDKLNLSPASFNNLKGSLKKKGFILENSFRKGIYLSNLKFEFEITTDNTKSTR